MTGSQLPLYVMLHATVMTSFSCAAAVADKFVVQTELLARSKTTCQAHGRISIIITWHVNVLTGDVLVL